MRSWKKTLWGRCIFISRANPIETNFNINNKIDNLFILTFHIILTIGHQYIISIWTKIILQDQCWKFTHSIVSKSQVQNWSCLYLNIILCALRANALLGTLGHKDDVHFGCNFYVMKYLSTMIIAKGVSRNLVWGCSWNIFGQKASRILSFCDLKAKTKSYPLHNSLGLGGANAPLHPLWLRYWL